MTDRPATDGASRMSAPARAEESPTRFPWMPILVLGTVWFLAVAIELSPAGLLGSIAADLDVSITAVGTMTTFYALGNAILVLPLTALAIRFATRTALSTVMVVFVLSNAFVALAPGIVAADIGRFIGGAAYGVICTLFPAVIIRITGPRFATRGITVAFTATSLGVAFGAPLASVVGNTFGWRVTFFSAAALALVLGVVMSFFVPRVRTTTAKGLTLRETVRLPGVLRSAIAWALVMLADFMVLTYVEAYVEDVGMPASVTGLSLFVIGIGGIIGSLLVGTLSSRSVTAALVASPALVGVGFVVLFLGGGSLAVLLTAILIWGIGISASVVVYQQVLLLTGARAPESATSIGVLLTQAGFAAGASVGGVTIDLVGVRALPLVALAFVLGSVLIALTLRGAVQHAEHLAHGQAPVAGGEPA